jgi:hypothetical protein
MAVPGDEPREDIPPMPFVTMTPGSQQYAKRAGGVDGYERTRITEQEVNKLVRSPEFHVFYRKNGEYLRAMDRAESSRAQFVAILAFAVSLFAIYALPFADGDDVLGHRTLAEVLEPGQRLNRLVGVIPMVDLLATTLGFRNALPLALFAAYLYGLGHVGTQANLIAAVSLVALLVSLGALTGGLGFYVIFAVIFVKSFLAY